MKKMLITTLALLAFVACSSKEKRTQAENTVRVPSPQAKEIAKVENATFVTEFTFDKGSSTLNASAQDQINTAIRRAQSTGKPIKEIRVITWADQEYPSTNTKRLSKSQRNIVSSRNKEIKNFVAKVDKNASVATYSMAERPGYWKELLKTSDAKMKDSLEKAGIPTTETKAAVSPKASKSIVMVLLEQPEAAKNRVQGVQ